MNNELIVHNKILRIETLRQVFKNPLKTSGAVLIPLRNFGPDLEVSLEEYLKNFFGVEKIYKIEDLQ